MPSPASADPVASSAVDAALVAANRIEQLEQALARAQSLYEQAPCGCLSIDPDLRILNINQTLKTWLGLPDLDWPEKPHVLHIVQPQWLDAVQSRLRELRTSGHCEPLHLGIQRADGTPMQAVLSATPVCDAGGRFLHANAMLRQDTGPPTASASHPSARAEFLQSVTDRMASRLAYYDKNLICQFANKAQAERYRMTPTQMVGTPLSDVIRPEALAKILPRVAAALSGNAQTFEVARKQKNGQREVFLLSYLPDAQPTGIEGVFMEAQNITERKRTEEFVLEANRDLEDRVRERSEDLFQSEQRYRLMIDAIQDYCIYFVDAKGRVTDWTESAKRLHGHRRTAMLGKPYQSLLINGTNGEDEVDAAQVMRLAQAHGQWETRGWRLRDDGSRFWAHTVLTALRNETGELQGLSSITRDMSAAKSLEDVMNDLNRELEERVAERTQQLVAANKDIDVFSHMVSHDLRAPLRHIASFVSLLLEHMSETGDKLALQYLNSIAKSSKRMGQMVEGLLEYARLGRVAIDVQPVPLAPLLEGVIAHLRQSNPERNIEWVIAKHLPVASGDAMLLAQVWDNLLGNSVKYTRRAEKARIEIGWQLNAADERTFYVRDNGVGFDLATAGNLFVMFQRQHHSMDFEGTGTGLAITQRIIERHRGRIWVETDLGKGCTFFFTLPFNSSEPAPKIPRPAMAELAG